MFKKLFISLSLLLSTTLCFSQEVVENPPNFGAVVSSVKGLELPPDQTVKYNEGFIPIKAECKGEVKWLIVTQYKVKYVVVSPNTIIVSIPPDVPKAGGLINVFAVGNVDGKLTDFARTNITVTRDTDPVDPVKPPDPVNPPDPVDPPPLVTGKLHLTFLYDKNNVTPALAKLVNSENLVKGINDRGHWFRTYDIKSDVVNQKGLTPYVQKVGGNNVLIVQTENSQVVSATVIPGTENEVFALISRITGKK